MKVKATSLVIFITSGTPDLIFYLDSGLTIAK